MGEFQCENVRIFLSFVFYVKSIFENLKVLKLPFLRRNGTLNFVTLEISAFNKRKFKIQSLSMYSNGSFLAPRFCQLWFHVKTERQKNSVISTLCQYGSLTWRLEVIHRSSGSIIRHRHGGIIIKARSISWIQVFEFSTIVGKNEMLWWTVS